MLDFIGDFISNILEPWITKATKWITKKLSHK